jgi:amino acid adenylation domain-containing protein
MAELRERLSHLSPEKLDQLERRLKLRAAATPAKGSIPRTGDGPHRLSFGQQRLWFIEQLEPASGAYNLAWALRLKGPLQTAALQQALDAVVVRQEALRTVFREIEGVPLQFVEPARAVEMRQIDLSADPAEDTIRAALTSEAGRKFDLTRDLMIRSTLLRLQDQDHILLVTLHHIAADGWSRGILLRELSHFYTAFATSSAPSLPGVPISYVDFSEWQRGTAEASAQKQLEYWRQQLDGAPPVLNLPTDFPRPNAQSYRGARKFLVLEKDLMDQLKALSQRHKVTLFMTLLAAFQVLLQRYTGEADIVVGVPAANRDGVEIEGLIGFFVNSLAMRTNLSGALTFADVLSRVRETTLGAYAHQQAPFERIIDALNPPRQRGHSPIFQVMLVLLNAPAAIFEAPGLSAEIVEVETAATQFDLVVEMIERSEGIVIRLAYCTDLFEAATAQRLLGHLQTLLRAVATNPDAAISRLPLLTEPEKQQLLVDWNQTRVSHPASTTLDLFEAQAARTPNAVAAVDEARRWTYAELNRHAGLIAAQLQARGAGKGTLVAVGAGRSAEMLAALLGIWKTGAAYLPLDPHHPGRRLAMILEDAKPSVVLTDARHRDIASEALPVVLLEDCGDGAASEAALSPATSEDVAYVIYTSGSTGKPKGVVINHGSLTNLLCAMQRRLDLKAADVWLAITTISFDIAGLELFLPLITGARVAIASRETASDGARLAAAIDRSDATVMQATPASWQMLFDTGWRVKKGLKILCGGEALPAALAGRLKTEGGLLNVYGPTETTIWSTIASIGPNDHTISIGRPLDNTELYVLDREMQPVPIGVPGELYIGGAGLAAGYWNRPDLTAERFVGHPFDATPGARLYRTGDLARYFANGDVECLGRLDDQVKIRGFRIELGEIETVLARQPGVRRCVVAARPSESGENMLVAYVEPAENATVDSKTLRAELRNELPDYMIPAAFVSIAALPLTPNGKIDRKALPAPEPPAAAPNAYVPPRDDLEQTLIRVWTHVLKVAQIGLRDDFFELGGNSLTAVRLLFEVKKATGKELPLAVYFQNPTVEGMAISLRDAGRPAESSVVVMQPLGAKPPLVLIHGAEGNVLLYRQLIRHLGHDRPVFGLQSRGLNEDVPLLTTVPEMASRCIQDLVTIQPRGPYRLGGYCLGGLIALEMAHQLEAHGEKVDLVVLLDSYHPELERRSSPVLRRFRYFVENLWFHLANAASVPWRDGERFIRQKLQTEAARAGIRMRAAYYAIRRWAGARAQVRYPYLRLQKVNDRAAADYIPPRYDGRVLLIRSKGAFSGLEEASLGWGESVRDGLEVLQVNAYPKGMLTEPFCESTAATLKQHL